MNFTIKFRPLQTRDARFINELRQLDEMEKFIGGARRPVSYERELKWVEDLILNDDQYMVYYAITEIDSEDIIGYTSISEIDYRNGTCFWSGIKLSADVAGKGYGTQVALKILKYAFEELRMVRCVAECQSEHEAALKLMLKAGYQKEGLMRKRLFKNGRSIDQWLLSVTDEDYVIIKEKNKL